MGLHDAPLQQERAPLVRAKAKMTVRWELPASAIDFTRRKERGESVAPTQSLMVGLFRMGMSSNTSSIISKHLMGKDTTRFHFGSRVQSNVLFFAPKSVGMFVLRIYDENDPSETLATTPPWGVGAQGRDIDMSVRFILSQLRAASAADGKGAIGALSQLSFSLQHIDAMPPQRLARSMAGALWQAVAAAWDQLCLSIEGLNEETDPIWMGAEGRRTRAMHGAVHEVLSSMLGNRMAWRLLDVHGPGPQPDSSRVDPVASAAPPLQIIFGWQQLWCSVTERYYPHRGGTSIPPAERDGI